MEYLNFPKPKLPFCKNQYAFNVVVAIAIERDL